MLNVCDTGKLADIAENILFNNILPFWMTKAVDEENGGFYGNIDSMGAVKPNYYKSATLNCRILWCFSSAYRIFNDTKYLEMAQRAWTYIIEHFWDNEYLGIYEIVDGSGNPLNTKKHIYSQAFAVYAFSEYYRATADIPCLNKVRNLYELIEKKCKDEENGGYFEVFSREWVVDNEYRYEFEGVNFRKTMNAHLHIMEAYTNLLRAWQDERLKKNLKEIVENNINKILKTDNFHYNLYFENDWTPNGKIISSGHDIEGSWLLCEAAQALGDPILIEQINKITIQMCESVCRDGIDSYGGIVNNIINGQAMTYNKEWWPQAEAVVGFLNAYQLTGDKRFYDAGYNVLQFVDNYFVDREVGEWNLRVSRDGKVLDGRKVDPWKCPYHNSRMCYELIARFR